MQRDIIGGKIPHDIQSDRLINSRIVGGVPRHRNRGRSLVPLGQDSAVVIDGGIVGAPHGGQPLFEKDGLCGIQKRLGNDRILDKVKESKEADGVLVVFVVGAVDDRRNATDRIPIAVGNEGSDLPVLF